MYKVAKRFQTKKPRNPKAAFQRYQKSLESGALLHFLLLFLQNRSSDNVLILPETAFLI